MFTLRQLRAATEFHSNNHPVSRQRENAVSRSALHPRQSSGTWRAAPLSQVAILKGWAWGMLFLLSPPHITAHSGSFLQTSLQSCPMQRHWAHVTRVDRQWPAVSLCCIVTPVRRITCPLPPHRCAVACSLILGGLKHSSAHTLLFWVQMQALKIQWISMWTCEDMKRLSGNKLHANWMDEADIYQILAMMCIKMLTDLSLNEVARFVCEQCK